MIAIRLSRVHQRVAAVAASNCPAHVANFQITPLRRLLLGVAEAIAPIATLRINVDHFYSYDQLISDHRWVRTIAEDPLVTEARRLSAATYASLVREWDGEVEVRRLTKPLLLLQGLRDELQPPSETDTLFIAAREPKTRIGLDTGHLSHLERPDAVATAIAEWLKGLGHMAG